MDKRDWLAGAGVAFVFLTIAIFYTWPDRKKADEAAWQRSFDQLMAPPNRDSEDRAVVTVERLGGRIVRRDDLAYRPVHRVDLGSCPVTDADLKELAGLDAMTDLVLADTRVSDAGLKELAGLGAIESFDLSGTAVTDAGLGELRRLRLLQALDLSRTGVTGAGLAQMNGQSPLRRLSLAGSKATDAGLAGLAGVPVLQELDLSGTQVTDAGLAALKPLGDLGKLNLRGTKVTGRSADLLLGLAVDTVDLTGVPLTVDEYVRLRDARARHASGAVGPGARAGKVPGVTPPLPGPAPPKDVESARDRLTVVGLRSAITDEWLLDLAGRGHLDRLVERLESIDFEQPGDGPAEYRVLDLSESRVTDAGLGALRGFGGFDNLNLSDTAVGDAGLTQLHGHAKLRALRLQKTNLTDAGLEELHRLAALEIVDVSGTAVTEVGIAKLKAALPKCRVWR